MGATKSLGLCDICGFRYPLRELKKNSYGMMVCNMDYEGKYDRHNHPQNRIARVTDDENIRDARPQRPLLVSAVPVSAWLPEL
jgi:hypothetical protein